MENLETRTSESLKFLLWACLQDNLNRMDIASRAKDESFRRSVLREHAKAEKLIEDIRKELTKRGEKNALLR